MGVAYVGTCINHTRRSFEKRNVAAGTRVASATTHIAAASLMVSGERVAALTNFNYPIDARVGRSFQRLRHRFVALDSQKQRCWWLKTALWVVEISDEGGQI